MWETHTGALLLISHRSIPLGGLCLPQGYSRWEIGVYEQTTVLFGLLFSLTIEKPSDFHNTDGLRSAEGQSISHAANMTQIKMSQRKRKKK